VTGIRTVVIAPASDDDRAWAAGLMANSEPWMTLGRGIDRCLQVCRDPDYAPFIAHLEGERCGVLILQARGVAGSPYVVSLAVAPQMRGRGVGARLLAFAEEYAAARSAHLFLCVSSFNLRARRFYERHGFELLAEFDDYVIAGASELLMHKRLRPA